MKVRFLIGMVMAIPAYTFLLSKIPAEDIGVHPYQLVGATIQIFGLGLIIGSSGK
jgi:hypothetical protein